MEDNKTKEAQQLSVSTASRAHNNRVMIEYFSNLHSRMGGFQALRIVYESFYFKCGYLPFWDPQARTTGKILKPALSDLQLTSEDNAVKGPSKRPTKVMAVESNKHNLKQFTEEDFEYIIGSQTKFKDVVTDDDELELREVARYLELLLQDKEEGRQNAVLKMFQWLTGYNSYKDAYMNPMEKRIMYRKGLMQD